MAHRAVRVVQILRNPPCGYNIGPNDCRVYCGGRALTVEETAALLPGSRLLRRFPNRPQAQDCRQLIRPADSFFFGFPQRCASFPDTIDDQ